MLQSVKQLLKAQSDVAMYLHDDTETIKRLKDRGMANDVLCLLVVPNTACSCPSGACHKDMNHKLLRLDLIYLQHAVHAESCTFITSIQACRPLWV